MKNSKLVKIVLIMLISVIMILMSREVFAANNIDITPTINSTSNNTISNSSSTNTTNSSTNNVLSSNNKTNNSVLRTNNTSTYNNSSLPKTGIEDSLPITVLVVVLGISAVYAYKKIQYYKNI